MQIIITLYN